MQNYFNYNRGELVQKIMILERDIASCKKTNLKYWDDIVELEKLLENQDKIIESYKNVINDRRKE